MCSASPYFALECANDYPAIQGSCISGLVGLCHGFFVWPKYGKWKLILVELISSDGE